MLLQDANWLAAEADNDVSGFELFNGTGPEGVSTMACSGMHMNINLIPA